MTDIQTAEIIPFARVTLFRIGEPTSPGTGRSRRTAGSQSLFDGTGTRVLGAFQQAGDTRFAGTLGAPGEQVRAEIVGTAIADANGRFWFDLQDEGDYRAIAEAPGWFSIEESDDSGNVTIEGPVLVIPLKLTRVVEAQDAARPQLPNTGGGFLARGR